MVRWAHKNLRNKGLVIGSTAYRLDSDGVVTTADGDDPAPEHISVMRNSKEFVQVQVEAPAAPSPPPAPTPEPPPPPSEVQESEQDSIPEKSESEPKPKKGRRSTKKKK